MVIFQSYVSLPEGNNEIVDVRSVKVRKLVELQIIMIYRYSTAAGVCQSEGLTPMEVAVQSKQELDGTWWYVAPIHYNVGNIMP